MSKSTEMPLTEKMFHDDKVRKNGKIKYTTISNNEITSCPENYPLDLFIKALLKHKDCPIEFNPFNGYIVTMPIDMQVTYDNSKTSFTYSWKE